MAEMICITLKLFAAFQEAYQCPEIELQLPVGSPVSAVLDQVVQTHPQLECWRSVTRFGVNLQFVTPQTLLQPGDEVVLIPPVSGG
jgi:sulfur-carrier protein